MWRLAISLGPLVVLQIYQLTVATYHHYAIEYCQAHTTPGGKGSSEDPYMRDQMMYPARIVIMRDWANYCDPLPGGYGGDK
jgi:hypothetical protein